MSAHVKTLVRSKQAGGHGRAAAVTLGLGLCLLWNYWRTISELVEFWGRNEDYSVGILVPFVAAYMLWVKRKQLLSAAASPCWGGLGLLVFAQVVRLVGVYYGYGSAERYSLVFTVAGVVLLAAGRQVFWRMGWVLAFLLLMVPFPRQVHEMISLPLQSLATSAAVFCLELLGFFVARQGNILHLEEQATVAVAEACSGLRMLTAFIFVTAVMAFVLKRPVWQKTALLLFSLPLAILSNAIRIVATAVFVYYMNDPTLEERFHDVAGFLMMPLAILLAIGLLGLLSMMSPPGPRCAASAA